MTAPVINTFAASRGRPTTPIGAARVDLADCAAASPVGGGTTSHLAALLDECTDSNRADRLAADLIAAAGGLGPARAALHHHRKEHP